MGTTGKLDQEQPGLQKLAIPTIIVAWLSCVASKMIGSRQMNRIDDFGCDYHIVTTVMT